MITVHFLSTACFFEFMLIIAGYQSEDDSVWADSTSFKQYVWLTAGAAF